MPFAFKFEFVQGKLNVVTDTLSRCPALRGTVSVVRSTTLGFLGWMKLAATLDDQYQEMVTKAKEGDTRWVVKGELLQTPQGKWVVLALPTLRTALLAEAHDSVISGHFGREKTLMLLSRH